MNILLLLFAVVAINGQDVPETTESLLRAHQDLRLGHEFFEMNIIQSRDQLSTFVNRDSREFINSHMDTYASIKAIALNTTAEIDAIAENSENEECINAIRSRWNIQIQRYGLRLSRCLGVVNSRFIAWDRFLNDIHSTGHLTSNQVQNLGVAELSETSDFTNSNWDVSRQINRRFRIILGATLPYLNRYQEFLDAVAVGSEEAIILLTECDRQTAEDFTFEAEEDLSRARNCIS